MRMALGGLYGKGRQPLGPGALVTALTQGSEHHFTELAVGVLQYLSLPLFGDVRVDLGGGGTGVAQQFLHDAQFSAAIQKVRGEGMAQQVREYALVQAGLEGMAAHDLLNGTARRACVRRGPVDAGPGRQLR